MDKKLLKIMVNIRILQGQAEVLAQGFKELADQIEKYVKEKE